MNDNEKSNLKSSRNKMVEALEGAGAEMKGRMVLCPFHDDNTPSGNIYEHDGVWYFKCHTQGCGFHGDVISVIAKSEGCSVGDVMKRMGNNFTHVRKNNKPVDYKSEFLNQSDDEDDCPPPFVIENEKTIKSSDSEEKKFKSVEELKRAIKNITDIYIYVNPETGTPDLLVIRMQPPGKSKRFMQGRVDDEGFIVLKAPPKPLPLYNRSRIRKSDYIICVEGEKAVHAITDLGDNTIVATTSPGGAGKAKYVDWSPLAGKYVYLWPDNDPKNEKGNRTGFMHMEEVKVILESLDPAPILYWINPDDLDLPPKGDVVEFLDKYSTRIKKIEQLQSVMATAQPLGASKGVKVRIEEAICGKRETVKLPWYELHESTQALKPGTVTLLCGHGGSSKSLCTIQLAQYWHFELGYEVALYELEDDREYHLMRALAQLAKEPGITNEEWLKKNPEKAMDIFDENTEFLDRMGRMLYEAPTESVTLDRLAEWVDEQARSGKRVICIDPITAAVPGRESWITDQKFISTVKKSIVEYGASLFLVTHPKKGGGRLIDMDNLAGGACWSRFSQTIMWIKNNSEDNEVDVISNGIRVPHECNRILTILKARNSYGGGHNYAMDLRNLLLEEIGEIASKKDKK